MPGHEGRNGLTSRVGVHLTAILPVRQGGPLAFHDNTESVHRSGAAQFTLKAFTFAGKAGHQVTKLFALNTHLVSESDKRVIANSERAGFCLGSGVTFMLKGEGRLFAAVNYDFHG